MIFYIICAIIILFRIFLDHDSKGTTMGSTYTQTIRPARALFDKGDFTAARRELKTLVSDGIIDNEVLARLAICDFRLGKNDALIELRSSHYYRNMSSELKTLVLWHEFVGMVADMRFEPALNLLAITRANGKDAECVRLLGQVIMAVRQASVISTRATKIKHLDEALSLSKRVQDNNTGIMMAYIGLMNSYLILMAELMHGESDRKVMQECRDRIAAADPTLGKRLPAQRRLVNFTPSFKR